MAIERFLVYGLCLMTSLGKSQNLNTTDFGTIETSSSVHDESINETATRSSDSVISTLLTLESTSAASSTTPSIASSRTVLTDVSTSSSTFILGLNSSTADIYPSSAVSQIVNTVTQNTPNVNSTIDVNKSITTLSPGTVSTDFNFNKLSNSFSGITSNTVGVSSSPTGRLSVTQVNSSDIQSVVSNDSISSSRSDTVLGSTLIRTELINTTQTSLTSLAEAEALASVSTTKSVASLLDSSLLLPTESRIFSSQISNTKSLSSGLSAEFPLSHLDMQSTSFASSDNLTSIVKSSNSTIILTSLTTNFFTESVYSLANISSTSTPGISSSQSIELSTNKTLETISNVTSALQPSFKAEPLTSTASPVESTALLSLSSTQSYNRSSVRHTDHGVDSSHSSEIGVRLSPTKVSSSSDHYLDFSSIFSSETLISDTFLSSNMNKTPSLDILDTYSTPVPSVTTSEASVFEFSSYSFSSSADSQGVTKITSISPSVISEAAMLSSATPQMTTERSSSTNEHSTHIQTTPNNSTELPTDTEPRIYRMTFTFDGHCEILSENEVLQMEFLKALMDVVKSTTKLSPYNLEAERILCDPLRVYLLNETKGLNISHLSEPLKRRIASSDFIVPIIQTMHVLNFTATNFDIVEIISSDVNGLEVAKSGLEMVDIVIISIASFLFAVLLIMMIVVICRECYVRKRTTTFHLRDVPHVNLKLSEFTLTRIPRPQMFYRENSRRKHGPIPVSKMRKPQSNGHTDTKDKVKVNQDQIRVRMSKHDDGLVVGVTCSAPSSPTNNSSSCSSTPKSGDPCKTSLLKGSNKEISDGVTNPSYSTDEELNGNTKIFIQEDENEQLL